MGSKGSAEALATQFDEVRDRAADMLASDGGSRGASSWPERMLWLGLGVGIGAAASGGRLMNVLPTHLASRLDDLVGQVTSAATGLAEKAGSFAGDTSDLVGEAISPEDRTIDVSAEAPESVTGGVS